MAGASGLPDSPLAGMHPVLVLAPGSTPAHPDPPPALRFYSLRSHATVHSLALSAPALALAASRRLLLISFPGQLAAFDAVTLEQKFTCLAYSPPSLPHPSVNSNGHEAAIPLPAAVPFALGPAWLAYPSPQVRVCCTHPSIRCSCCRSRQAYSPGVWMNLGVMIVHPSFFINPPFHPSPCRRHPAPSLGSRPPGSRRSRPGRRRRGQLPPPPAAATASRRPPTWRATRCSAAAAR